MSSEARVLTTYYYDPNSQSFNTKQTTKNLGPTDILIKTTHSGICYTDVHAKQSDKQCGLGHEGIGTVIEIGIAVTQFKPGDRVGWGWLHTSCGHCSTCVSGYRQYCFEARGFAFSDLDQGAFSDARVIDAAFAYKIPESIESVHAAPLMCAGASVYEALDAAGTKPSDRVGVVGVGGLGHVAILFAKAMGCSVTALSSSRRKMQDAWTLGADEYRDLSDIATKLVPSGPALTEADSKNINVLLITSNAVPDLSKTFPLLAERATIVLMTIQQDAISVPYMDFVLPGHRLIASTEASRENHIKMLEFAERHNIRPWVEVFAMDKQGLEQAFSKLEAGEMRYRGVLEKGSS